MISIRKAAVILIVLATPMGALADAKGVEEFMPYFLRPVSTASIYFSKASDSSKGIGASLDLGLKNHFHLYGSGFQTIIESSDLQYETNATTLGFSTDSMEPWFVSVDRETWGVKEHITMYGMTTKVGWNLSNWQIVMGYGERQYTLSYDPSYNRAPLDVDSIRRLVEVSYFGVDTAWFVLRYEDHGFSKRIDTLQNPLIYQFFTDIGNAASSALINSSYEVELGYGQKKWNLSVAATISESAVDETDTNSYAARYYRLWQSSVATTLTAGISQQDSAVEGAEDISYVELGLSFSWR